MSLKVSVIGWMRGVQAALASDAAGGAAESGAAPPSTTPPSDLPIKPEAAKWLPKPAKPSDA